MSNDRQRGAASAEHIRRGGTTRSPQLYAQPRRPGCGERSAARSRRPAGARRRRLPDRVDAAVRARRGRRREPRRDRLAAEHRGARGLAAGRPPAGASSRPPASDLEDEDLARAGGRDRRAARARARARAHPPAARASAACSTRRERRFLGLQALGLSYQEIAAARRRQLTDRRPADRARPPQALRVTRNDT